MQGHVNMLKHSRNLFNFNRIKTRALEHGSLCQPYHYHLALYFTYSFNKATLFHVSTFKILRVSSPPIILLYSGTILSPPRGSLLFLSSLSLGYRIYLPGKHFFPSHPWAYKGLKSLGIQPIKESMSLPLFWFLIAKIGPYQKDLPLLNLLQTHSTEKIGRASLIFFSERKAVI